MTVKARYVCVPQGGMKAVIWTDVFQTFIMLAGMLAVVIQVRAIHVVSIPVCTETINNSIIIQFTS